MDIDCENQAVMWECDYCHLLFDTLKEAEEHEKKCFELQQDPIAVSFIRQTNEIHHDSESLILLQDHGLIQTESEHKGSDSSILAEPYGYGGEEDPIILDFDCHENESFLRKLNNHSEDTVSSEPLSRMIGSISPTFDSVRINEDLDQSNPLCPEDIEFLKNSAVDDVIRFHCVENETILISMLCTWRLHLGMPKLANEEVKSRVQRWFALKQSRSLADHISWKRNVKHSPPANIPDNELVVMEDIDHLCHMVHTSGYPCLLKTVMDPFTDTLYDFKVEVRQSLIEDAGLGLFLTFLGARCLKPDVKKWSQALKSHRHTLHVPTKEELLACLPDNSNLLVKLKGENLHGNHNNPFFSITRFPLYARISDRAKAEVRHIKVTLQGLHLHEDIDYLHAKGLIPSSESGLGWMGVFSESDYIRDDTISFSSYHYGCGLVHLGRYGPFQKSDRKDPLEFNLKDFIFSSEPAVWNFGDDKVLIDITEDSTGLPHAQAKDAMCMYCNEVGHDRNLEQTVLALEKDNGSVHYYIKIRDPLYFGESLELLVSYTESYEESRERKGYGLNNKKGLRNDTDLTERTCRNIHDRLWLERGISSSSPIEFRRITSFIYNQLLKPLDSFIQNYAQKLDDAMVKFSRNSSRLSQSLISRRRIKWLGEIFKSYSDKRTITSAFECKIIKEMSEWQLDLKLLQTSDSINALKAEIFEEWVFTIYRVYGNAHLFDPACYCKLSRDLSTYLLENISLYNLSQTNYNPVVSVGRFYAQVNECIHLLHRLMDKRRMNDDDLELIGFRYNPTKTQNLPHLVVEEHYGEIKLNDMVIFLVKDRTLSRCCMAKAADVGKLSTPPNIYIDWYVLHIVATAHMIAEIMPDFKNGDSDYSLDQLCASVNVNSHVVNSWIQSIRIDPIAYS